MLMPKRVKYRKQQRGRMRGKAYRGSAVTFGEFGRVGLDVVRRHDRLTPSDESAQPNIVAFGALGFLNRAIAHLHRK